MSVREINPFAWSIRKLKLTCGAASSDGIYRIPVWVFDDDNKLL